MSKITENYKNLASGIGFTYDEFTNTIYGTKNGYELLIYATDQRYPYLFTITTSARSATVSLGKDEISLFKKSVAPAMGMTQKDSLITVTNKNQKNQSKLCSDLGYTIDALTAFLSEKGFIPCCQTCGASTQTVGFMLETARLHLCADCAARTKSANEVNIFESFQAVPTLVAELDGMGDYIASFLQQMLFVVVGAVPTIISITREQRNVNRVAQIGYMQNANNF